jgi:hypothetical protein
MIPFRYRDFYDIPRMIFFIHKNKSYLFHCDFDDKNDEYSPIYSVCLMPNLNEDDLSGSWELFCDLAISKIGNVKTKDVIFDKTKRKYLNSDILNKLE